MPIGKADVLEVLRDARLRNIHFSVGPINVSPTEYDRVADYINYGSIRVVPGGKSYPEYTPQINSLSTAVGDPPLGLPARATLLHECTHMIGDINKCKVTRLTDEVAAYLAQTAYYLLLDPLWAELSIGGPPLHEMTRHSRKLVEKYSLGQPAGMGAIIDQGDIASLAPLVQAISIYSHIGEDEMMGGRGVDLSDKHKIAEKYRQELMQLANETLDKLAADEVAQLLTQMMTVRSVSKENYVTSDSELHRLVHAYERGDAAQKKDVRRKLLRIFSTIDQRSAERLTKRLPADVHHADDLSACFQRAFPPPARRVLLSALRIRR